MNKISIFMAAAAVVLGVSSCSEDRDPVYQAPTTYVLNVPAMQDQYIALEKGATLELVSSQPDYGYSAITEYSAEMSLSPDFATFESLEPVDPTQARLMLKQEKIAEAICKLQGIEEPEQFEDFYGDPARVDQLYFRTIAQLSGVESSKIVSNVVSYNNVRTYFAVPQPGCIYLVGSPEGWAGPTEANAAHYEDWKLTEPKDAIGSKVYTGVFVMPTAPMFRFYTALTGWDADSYGSQPDDNPIDFPDLTNAEGASFTTPVVKGKGAFNFPNWTEGKMTIVVDMSDSKNITLTITAGESEVTVSKYIYLVGSLSGWGAPEEGNAASFANYRLVDNSDSGIYTGTFAVPAGHLNFRFALSLSESDGWNNPNQIGAAENDGDVACTLAGGTYNGSYVLGKGNWAFEIDQDCNMVFTVDTNNRTVSFKQE